MTATRRTVTLALGAGAAIAAGGLSMSAEAAARPTLGAVRRLSPALDAVPAPHVPVTGALNVTPAGSVALNARLEIGRLPALRLMETVTSWLAAYSGGTWSNVMSALNADCASAGADRHAHAASASAPPMRAAVVDSQAPMREPSVDDARTWVISETLRESDRERRAHHNLAGTPRGSGSAPPVA